MLTVGVNTKKFEANQLHQTIANVGHDTQNAKAPDEVYEQLHACCKYRDTLLQRIHKEIRAQEAAFANETTTSQEHPNPSETTPLLEDVPDLFTDYNEKAFVGMVYEKDENGNRLPLTGVNVFWEGTTTGATTDEKGFFEVSRIEATDRLVFSYVGYASDTIRTTNEQMVAIVLSSRVQLDAVEVTHKKRSAEISFLSPIKTLQINEAELLKAACCNLSESFETTPAVDVSFTDAITGIRKIELLGLSSPYVQIMRENIPNIRGLSALHGFEFTPGTWIEGIQLNLGAGSVANGFESVSGQINVELRKPEDADRLYLNLYGNQMGRLEANLNFSHVLNDQWSTAILLHGKYMNTERDRNSDNFMGQSVKRTMDCIKSMEIQRKEWVACSIWD